MNGDYPFVLASQIAATTPKVIASSATPVQIFGATGSGNVPLATVPLPAGSIMANSVLTVTLDFDFQLPDHAGRTVYLYIGGQLIGQAAPTATVGSFLSVNEFEVGPDLQTVTGQTTAFLTGVISPAAGQAPYSAQTGLHQTVSVDLTQAQTLTIVGKPINDDVMTLNGFSVLNVGLKTPANYAPSTATAYWGDSLTAGTGSQGNAVLDTTGTFTNGTPTITSTASTTTYLNFTGSGVTIPNGSLVIVGGVVLGIVTGVSGSTVTMSANFTGTTGSASVRFMTGPLPSQYLYTNLGVPVSNLGIGGQTSAQIVARMLRDTVRGKLQRCAIWMGRNDVGNASLTSVVMGNLALGVANLASGVKYVIATIIPAANEYVGSANYTAIAALNAAIKALYGAHVADVFGTLTNSGTTNIALQYRNCTNTTTATVLSSGGNSFTVASATGLANGMYCISPGSTAIDNGSTAPTGSTYTAPTITVSGTTITLSANASGTLASGSMVSFVNPGEVHLNDLGYSVVQSTVSTVLAAQ